MDTAGDTIGCIAKLDGTNWVRLGQNLSGFVNVMIFDAADKLYAGGILTVDGTMATGIARWDGVRWDTLGVSRTGEVKDFTSDTAGNLLAAGDLDFSAGSQHIYGVGKWNGLAWLPVLGTLSIPGHIYTIGVSHTSLVIGGNFSLPACGPGDTVRSILFLKWDGHIDCYADYSCEEVDNNGKPINGDVYKIAVSSDLSKVWYAGRFVTINGILHYGFNKSIDPMFSAPGAYARSVGLAVEPVGNDGVFLAGGYGTPTSTSLQYVGSCFPDFNYLMAASSTNGNVRHLAFDSLYNRIYIAGSFDTAGKQYSPYLARVDLAKAVSSANDVRLEASAISGQIGAKLVGDRMRYYGLPAGTARMAFYSLAGRFLKAFEVIGTSGSCSITFPRMVHNATICRVTAGRREYVFMVGR